MAKKATKKASSFLTKYGKWILLAFAALLLVMLALTGAKIENKIGNKVITSEYGLAKLVFGGTLVSEQLQGIVGALGTDVKVDFSFLAFVAVFLPILLTAISFFIKNKKISGALVFASFAISAVLFFIMPQITSLSFKIGSSVTTDTFAELEAGLGVGSIIGGIIAILGALVSLGYTVSKD